ncbi:FixH family protein [Planococcus sp. ISL-110]|uniref:FixH family protein n=1 Tax=Planococcus sp. ISL-110 TaxID=2819167 RepID=UPI001BEAEC25|nr:FixH family protein [Planococcus sp. ISL-110]MBT2569799.1 FixH family protein [Planococcus sp. ISL-110]
MKKLMVIGAFGLMLAGCGMEKNSADNASAAEQEVKELEVQVLTEPVGETGEWTLEAFVSQGGEAVNDANEVKFEVFEAGKKDESVKNDYTDVKDGVYSIKHTFQEDGVYYFIPHVTARSMHTMPTQQVIVGQVTDEEIRAAEEAMAKAKAKMMEDKESGTKDEEDMKDGM